jgi:hypothetical protein
MAFTLNNWACSNVSLSAPQETITPFGGSPTVENSPNLYLYGSPNDSVATISASNYFLPQWASLGVGDLILGFGTDASLALQVTAVSSTSVTVESMGLTTSIGTANIVNGAVTYAKIQNASVGDVLLANPTGSAHAYEEVTLGNGLSFSGTTLQVNTNLTNEVEVSISASQFNGMYAAPIQLVAAPGANELLIFDKLVLEQTYGSAAFASGGVVAVQYDSTADGAGVIASTTLSAASFFVTASSTYTLGGGAVVLPFTTTVNKGLYLSNVTGAFTTGDSTFTAKVYYKIVPSNS